MITRNLFAAFFILLVSAEGVSATSSSKMCKAVLEVVGGQKVVNLTHLNFGFQEFTPSGRHNFQSSSEAYLILRSKGRTPRRERLGMLVPFESLKFLTDVEGVLQKYRQLSQITEDELVPMGIVNFIKKLPPKSDSSLKSYEKNFSKMQSSERSDALQEAAEKGKPVILRNTEEDGSVSRLVFIPFPETSWKRYVYPEGKGPESLDTPEKIASAARMPMTSFYKSPRRFAVGGDLELDASAPPLVIEQRASSGKNAKPTAVILAPAVFESDHGRDSLLLEYTRLANLHSVDEVPSNIRKFILRYGIDNTTQPTAIPSVTGLKDQIEKLRNDRMPGILTIEGAPGFIILPVVDVTAITSLPKPIPARVVDLTSETKPKELEEKVETKRPLSIRSPLEPSVEKPNVLTTDLLASSEGRHNLTYWMDQMLGAAKIINPQTQEEYLVVSARKLFEPDGDFALVIRSRIQAFSGSDQLPKRWKEFLKTYANKDLFSAFAKGSNQDGYIRTPDRILDDPNAEIFPFGREFTILKSDDLERDTLILFKKPKGQALNLASIGQKLEAEEIPGSMKVNPLLPHGLESQPDPLDSIQDFENLNIILVVSGRGAITNVPQTLAELNHFSQLLDSNPEVLEYARMLNQVDYDWIKSEIIHQGGGQNDLDKALAEIYLKIFPEVAPPVVPSAQPPTPSSAEALAIHFESPPASERVKRLTVIAQKILTGVSVPEARDLSATFRFHSDAFDYLPKTVGKDLAKAISGGLQQVEASISSGVKQSSPYYKVEGTITHRTSGNHFIVWKMKSVKGGKDPVPVVLAIIPGDESQNQTIKDKIASTAATIR